MDQVLEPTGRSMSWICRNCQKKLGITEVYSIGNFIERRCVECGKTVPAEDIDRVPPDQLQRHAQDHEAE